jgi:hypothetical protein
MMSIALMSASVAFIDQPARNTFGRLCDHLPALGRNQLLDLNGMRSKQLIQSLPLSESLMS